MNELINIEKARIQDKETLAVNTRELYKALELGDGQYSRWIQNNLLKDEVFKENSDFIRVRHKVEGNQVESFIVTIETAKHLAMLARNEKGYKIREYFITCEKSSRSLKAPANYIEALELALNQAKQIQSLENKIFALTHTSKTYTITEIAKELGFKSAIELNKKLSQMKVQYHINGTWVMYSKYSDLGYESIKQEILDNSKIIYQRRITGIGREFILSLFENKD